MYESTHNSPDILCRYTCRDNDSASKTPSHVLFRYGANSAHSPTKRETSNLVSTRVLQQRVSPAWVAFARRYGLLTCYNTITVISANIFLQTVKKSAKVIIERYYPKLTLDFETNKRICDEIAIIASKRLRNKVSDLARDPSSFPNCLQKAELSSPTTTDRRLHYTFNETYPTWSSARYLL